MITSDDDGKSKSKIVNSMHDSMHDSIDTMDDSIDTEEVNKSSSTVEELQLSRQQLEQNGNAGINQLFNMGNNKSYINIAKSMEDLKELNLISYSEDGRYVKNLIKGEDAIDILRENWVKLFDDKSSNNDFVSTKD